MDEFSHLADIRRDYGALSLSEDLVHTDPMIQFKLWFEEILQGGKDDPTAMVVSTVDEKGYPDSRVVLLKGIEEGSLFFYTNYQSHKALQIENNPHVALNFYWPHMARQVRIRGLANKVCEEKSDAYFSSRPISSQLSAAASPQSKEIADRKYLENALLELSGKHHLESSIPRPKHWGGYMITPEEFEFWQGRDNRLHDRIHYYRQKGQWKHHRLAP